MVSQSSTYVNSSPNRTGTYGPEKAIDRDNDTLAHTNCGQGAGVWYKIFFGKLFYVIEVRFSDFFSGKPNKDFQKNRMDGTRVLVTNKDKEELCETLHVPAEDTRQIYSINCGDKIGDGVILRGKEGKADSCIHIKEISVFGMFLGKPIDEFRNIFKLSSLNTQS